MTSDSSSRCLYVQEVLMAKIGRAVSWTAERRSADFTTRLRNMMKSVQEDLCQFSDFFLLKEQYSLFYEQLRLHVGPVCFIVFRRLSRRRFAGGCPQAIR